jgi:hypothetical protein
LKERIVTDKTGHEGRIFDLTTEEVRRLCRPGAGADTCIWLVAGSGFQCLYYNRRVPSLTGDILEDRWRAGKTVAKRDGCDEIRKR